MTNWFNPRIAAVAVSIIVLLQVSKIGEPHQTIRNDVIACAVLYLLYTVTFVVPLARCFGIKSVLVLFVTLTLSWLAVFMGLLADALPVSLSVQMQRRVNWPMAAFCVAGAVGFFLFFQNVARSFRSRDEMLEARGDRRE